MPARTRRFTIEVLDEDGKTELFTAPDWTDEERPIALAQIMRLTGARLPAKGADDKVLRVLEEAWQKIIGPSPKMQDLVHEVRELIIGKLSKGSANIDAIANELNMSNKTLERRLAGRGQSFSALLDETRCKTAKHYLEETDMRVSQIACMAGYTESAALVRAFKRWTGTTPMKFRDRSRDAAGRSARPTV
jgi:AraC-like DNA-binding protein